jgi:hypothetical protein
MKNAITCFGMFILFACAASLRAAEPTCPAIAPLTVAWTGPHCSNTDPTSRCGLDSPVTFTLMSNDQPYKLQSCETGVTWQFDDQVGTQLYGSAPWGSTSVQFSFPHAATWRLIAIVQSSTTKFNMLQAFIPAANGLMTMSPDILNADEAAGKATLHVKTTYAPTSVEYYTVDFQTGNAGVYFTPVSGTLSFGPGEYDKVIEVPLTNDTGVSFNRQFWVTIKNPTHGVVLVPNSVSLMDGQTWSKVYIIDDDIRPFLSFQPAPPPATYPPHVSEAAGAMTVILTRSLDLTRAFTVDYVVDDHPAGTLTFASGETSKTISIPIVNDHLWEPSRDHSIGLANPTNGAYFVSGPTHVIVDDDDPLPAVNISDTSVTEGDAGSQNVAFNLTLTQPLPVALQLNVKTGDGNATAPADYAVLAPHLVTFPPGVTTQTIFVTVNGDVAVEPDETFSLTGTNINGDAYGRIPVNPGTCTIVNDDRSMTWLKVAAGEKARMTIDFGSGPGATGAATLTSSRPDIAVVPASFSVAAHSRLQSFDVTALAPGTSAITAKLPASIGGGSVQAMIEVFETTPPATPNVTIHSVTPANGPVAGGTRVAIAGENLSASCTVSFGETAVRVVDANPATLTVITPAHTAGSVGVSVTCSDSASTLAGAFTFATPTRNRAARH